MFFLLRRPNKVLTRTEKKISPSLRKSIPLAVLQLKKEELKKKKKKNLKEKNN